MKSKPLFFAHRGYSSIAPENTMPAFVEAINAGFDGLECDVWETPGDGLMIMHDENLSRMCGVSQLITDLTPEQLDQFSITKGKNITVYGGSVPIPALSDYLELFRENDLVPVIEIKSKKPYCAETAMSEGAILQMLQLLDQVGAGDRGIIISFNLAVLTRLLAVKCRAYPAMELRTMYLTSAAREVGAERSKAYRELGIDAIGMKKTIAKPAAILEAQSHGLQVGVWVVDNKTLAKNLTRENRINYITSNKKVFPLE